MSCSFIIKTHKFPIFFLLLSLYCFLPTKADLNAMNFNSTATLLTDKIFEKNYSVDGSYESYVTLTSKIIDGKISNVLKANTIQKEFIVNFMTISDVFYYGSNFYICPGDFGNHHLGILSSEEYTEKKIVGLSGKLSLKCEYTSINVKKETQTYTANEIIVQYIGINKVRGYNLKNGDFENNDFLNSNNLACFVHVGSNYDCYNGNNQDDKA